MKSKEKRTPSEPRFSFMVVDDSEFACRNMERMIVAIGLLTGDNLTISNLGLEE